MKIYTANADEDTVLELGQKVESWYTNFDYEAEGRRLATWIAWNSTPGFYKALIKHLPRAIQSMEYYCENDRYETDEDGFPTYEKEKEGCCK